jgi:hypothetical protein
MREDTPAHHTGMDMTPVLVDEDLEAEAPAPVAGAALEAPGQADNDVPVFDTSKYRLGKLCPRGHDYGGTGQSLLRLANGGCLACNREDARTGREAKRQPAAIAAAAIPDPAGAKAELLAQIRRWHEAEQLGPQALADRLNAQQVPTLSGRGQWQKGTVSKLLKAQP